MDEVRIPIDKFQREEPVPAKTERLAKEWNWLLYDPIKIYATDDGVYEVYEGGHRVEAAQMRDITHLLAIQYDITDVEAADAYTKQSRNRVNITRYDEHKAALWRGDESARSLEDVVIRNGFTIAARRQKGSMGIAAVATLYSMLRQYGAEHIGETLKYAAQTWPQDPRLNDGAFLDGLALFLSVYGDKIDDEVTALLAEVPISRLLSTAEGFQQRTRRGKVAATLREFSKLRKKPNRF